MSFSSLFRIVSAPKTGEISLQQMKVDGILAAAEDLALHGKPVFDTGQTRYLWQKDGLSLSLVIADAHDHEAQALTLLIRQKDQGRWVERLRFSQSAFEGCLCLEAGSCQEGPWLETLFRESALLQKQRAETVLGRPLSGLDPPQFRP